MSLRALFSAEARKHDRKIWSLVLPCLLENMLTFFVALVTSAMIGRLSPGDISALGVSNRLTVLVTAVFTGIGVGTTVLVGLHYGEGRRERCLRSAKGALAVAAPLAAVLAALIFIFARPLLRFFTAEQELLDAARQYLRVAIWLCPFFAVSRVVTAAFNGQGDTVTPLVIAFTTNVVNALLCGALIFGVGPAPRLGLLGAAIGRLASTAIGAALGLALLFRPQGPFRGVQRLRGIFDREDLRRLFSAGLPAAGENVLHSLAVIVISRALLSYGSASYAAYQLATQIEEFFGAPAFAFSIAATALAAHSIGAGDRRLFRAYRRREGVLSSAVSLPIMALLLAAPRPLMSLITNKPELQRIGAIYLVLTAICYIPQILSMIDFGTVRAAGRRGFPLACTMAGLWGFRVPVACLCAWVLHAGIAWVFAGIAFDQVVRYIIGKIFIHKTKILKIKEENA